MDDIILSILVPTYGHEKYIREALDSILMQKTKYKYEVIVGEDASPDNTREILKEYERQFPDKFTMVYRDENAGGYGNGNSLDLVSRAKGKYFVVLEGDDFWISDSKIEKQVTFLEENPDYVAVSCNTIVVDRNSNITKEKYPECKDEKYTLKHFRRDILPGQTACMMYRTEVCKLIHADSIWSLSPVPGDRILILGLASKGKIHCIQETMSAYRHIVSEGNSYSARNKRCFHKELDWYENLVDFSRRQNNKAAEYAAEGRYLAFVFFEGLKKREINLKEFVNLYGKIEHKLYVPILKILDFII